MSLRLSSTALAIFWAAASAATAEQSRDGVLGLETVCRDAMCLRCLEGIEMALHARTTAQMSFVGRHSVTPGRAPTSESWRYIFPEIVAISDLGDHLAHGECYLDTAQTEVTWIAVSFRATPDNTYALPQSTQPLERSTFQWLTDEQFAELPPPQATYTTLSAAALADLNRLD